MAGMPIGGIPPQVPPPGAPPGMPPVGMPRPPQPPPGGGTGGPLGGASGMMMLLAFLAGGGLEKAVGSIGKLMKIGQPGTADPNRAHRGGVRLDAANNPGTTIAPQLAQVLAAKAGSPTGSDELVALLAKALQGQVGPAGALGKLG